MSSKTAALAGGGALVAVVLVVSVLVLGEDPPAPKILPPPVAPPTTPDRPDRLPASFTPPDRPTSGGTQLGDPGPATTVGTQLGDPAPPSRRPTDAPAPGAVEVTFRCTDDAGEALAGVWIEVKRPSGAPLDTLTSGPGGEARLERLPPGEAIQGVARHPLSNESVAFGPITIRAGSVVALKFRRGQTGRLSGQVVDERGQPVRGATLRLIDPKQAGEAVLDSVGMSLGPDGTFMATVAAGAYAISAEAPGFAASDRAYATVAANEEAGPVHLVLYRQGRISGRASLPPDLAALASAIDLVIEITRGTEENPYQRVDRRPLEVDVGFNFVVDGCDPARYRLRLEAPAAGGNRVGPWYSLTLAPGQSIDGVTLVLSETAPSVRGVVRDDRGLAIEGARVSVRGRQSTTDRDGRYTVHGLDEGEDILVEARADGHAGVTQQATYEGVALAIDLVLPRHGGVRGRVRGGGNVPVLVCLRSDMGVRPYQVAAGADGSYLLEGLPPGSYFIKAGQGANPFDAAGAPTVEVRPGHVAEAPDVALP